MDQYPHGIYHNNPPVYLPYTWSQQPISPANTPTSLQGSNIQYLYHPNVYPPPVISTNPPIPMMPVFMHAAPFYSNFSYPPPVIPSTNSHTDGELIRAQSYGIPIPDPSVYSLYKAHHSHDGQLLKHSYKDPNISASSHWLQQSETQQNKTTPQLTDHQLENGIDVREERAESKKKAATSRLNVSTQKMRHQYQQEHLDQVTFKMAQVSIQPPSQQLHLQSHVTKHPQEQQSEVTPSQLSIQPQSQQRHQQYQYTTMMTQQPVQIYPHQLQQQHDQVAQIPIEPQSHTEQHPPNDVTNMANQSSTLPVQQILPQTVSPKELTFITDDQSAIQQEHNVIQQEHNVIQQEHNVIQQEHNVIQQEDTVKTTEKEPEAHIQEQHEKLKNRNLEQLKPKPHEKHQEMRLEPQERNHIEHKHIRHQTWQRYHDPRQLRQEVANNGKQYASYWPHYVQEKHQPRQQQCGQQDYRTRQNLNASASSSASLTHTVPSHFNKPRYNPQLNSHTNYDMPINLMGKQLKGRFYQEYNESHKKETQRSLESNIREESSLKKDRSKYYRNRQFNRSSWNTQRLQ